MAHSLKVKAKAMALLLTGNTVNYVSSRLDIPRTTVIRWRDEAFREYLPKVRLPALGGLVRTKRTQKKGNGFASTKRGI